MDVLEAIKERRSVRSYLESPVEWDKVSTILESGRLSPSAGNVQEWKFIVVTDESQRKAVAQSAPNQQWMTKAPVMIVICADLDKIKRMFGVRGERLYSIQDCAIVATNMMLTAQSLGLGSCWIGAFEESMLQRTLGIPEHARPQVILTIGYTDQKPKQSTRLRLENMVYLEKYGNRIKDIGRVLWDFNVVGRAKDSVQKTAVDYGKKTKKDREKLAEKFNEKKKQVSDWVKDKKKKK